SGTAIGNRFMFQGREWYPEIGLYNFRNRFYDPTFGRFIQPDPLGFGGGDVNLFRYCGGDPVNNSDPSGEEVRLFGIGANFGSLAIASVSAQAGFSYGWRNP